MFAERPRSAVRGDRRPDAGSSIGGGIVVLDASVESVSYAWRAAREPLDGEP